MICIDVEKDQVVDWSMFQKYRILIMTILFSFCLITESRYEKLESIDGKMTRIEVFDTANQVRYHLHQLVALICTSNKTVFIFCVLSQNYQQLNTIDIELPQQFVCMKNTKMVINFTKPHGSL